MNAGFALKCFLMAGALSAPAILVAQSSRPNAVAPLITQAIDETELVPLKGNVHPLAQTRFDRGPVGGDLPTGKLMLVLRRSQPAQQALEQYLSEVQNPDSSAYHRWLSPEQFGARFGLADSDLQATEAWLQAHGLKIEKVSQARNVIQFSGTIGQLQGAFHTAIHALDVSGAHHVAAVADPQIPAALKGVIAGVAPLNDFHPVPQSKLAAHAHYDEPTHSIQPDLTLFDSQGNKYLFVDPADAAVIYDTPNATLNPNYSGTTYDGTGISIGIAGDSNVTMQDIINYRVAFLGETAATANTPTVVIDGQDPLLNGDEGEALLDNEIAGGIAPKAKLYLYTSANSDLQSGLFNAIFRALDDNTVSILNISFGACEAAFGASGNQLLLEASEQAAAQGISVTVSTGDSGSAGCDPANQQEAQGGLAVNGLASSPYVIAVGGTDYGVLATNFAGYVKDTSSGNPPYYLTAQSYIPEQVWNDSTNNDGSLADNQALLSNGASNVVAGGGGVSSIYSKPAFQSSATPDDKFRDLPDVSFLAGNGLYSAMWLVCADSFVDGSPTGPSTDCETANGAITRNTTFSGFGGTSAAAPTMAGILALVEQKAGSRLGQADNVLYQLAKSSYGSVFHDVTGGNNSVVCSSGSPDCAPNGFLTGYDAASGYDLATGLGSIDAAQLANKWNSVSLSPTTTQFNINGSTAPVNVTHGTKLTFHVAVTPSSATGPVSIIDTANQVSGGVQNNGQFAIDLSGGSGSGTYSGLPGGTYTVYARYGGDVSNAASASSPAIHVTIAPETSATDLTINAYSAAGSNAPITNLASIPYGSYIFADAQIYGAAEGANGTSGVATGSVKLMDNGSTVASGLAIGSANLASYQSPGGLNPQVFPVGAHSMVAQYTGDSSYNSSTSTPVAFAIVKGGTNLVVSSSNASISSAASTTITILIATTSLGSAPTGTITLAANGNTLATITGFSPAAGGGIVGSVGTATIQGRVLAAGANTITATYTGDGNYTGATSSTTVTVAAAAIALTNNGPVSFAAGATSGNTITVGVKPVNGFTGLVNLACAATTVPAAATSPVSCSVPASVNVTGTSSVPATLTITTESTTTPGAYVVTVSGTDAASGKITASTNVGVTVTAPPVPPGFSLTNSGNITVSAGATSGNTSTVSITPSGGFTGAVSLACTVPAASSTSINPTCGIPSSITVQGTAAATATLTITTNAGTTASIHPLRMLLPSGGGAALALLIMLGLPKRRRRWSAFVGAFILAVSITAIGCGGSGSGTPTKGSGGTTPGTYSVTVTGTDAATGKIVSTVKVSVTVN